MKPTDTAPNTRDDKPWEDTVEHTATNKANDEDVLTKDVVNNGERDAFGAQKKKTDPAEIALVRKLDLWIMVRLFCNNLLFMV